MIPVEFSKFRYRLLEKIREEFRKEAVVMAVTCCNFAAISRSYSFIIQWADILRKPHIQAIAQRGANGSTITRLFVLLQDQWCTAATATSELSGGLYRTSSTGFFLCLIALMLFHPAPDEARAGGTKDTLRAPAEAAAVDSSAPPLRWYTMFANIPGDWARFGESTFRKENLPGFVGMAVLTVGLMVADDETWTLSHRWYQSHGPTRGVSDFFEYLGDGRPQFTLSAAFGAYGLLFRDQRALRTGSQIVEAILSCGVVVQVLKHVTGRESPFVSTVPAGRWDFFPNQIEYHKHVPRFDAYPSGHIATALATVTVIAENYPEWKWVRPAGYTICALIGISMANTGIHWYSDYPLGLFLGYAFGMIASHPERGHEETRAAVRRIVVEPMMTINGPGIGLAYRF